ncbi:MAG: hypothetical protein ABFE07_17690 [Armatimonadia bacterium]
MTEQLVVWVLGAGLLLIVVGPFLRDLTLCLFMPPPALQARDIRGLLLHLGTLAWAYFIMSLALAISFTASQISARHLLLGGADSPNMADALPVPLMASFVAVVVARATAITSSHGICDGLWDAVAVATIPILIAAATAEISWLPDQAALVETAQFPARQPQLLIYLGAGLALSLLVEATLWYIGTKGVRWPVPVSVIRNMMLQGQQVDEIVLGTEAVRSMYASVLTEQRTPISHIMWFTMSSSDTVAIAIREACLQNPNVQVNLLADPASLQAARTHVVELQSLGISASCGTMTAGTHHYLLIITVDGHLEMACAYGRPSALWEGPEWGFRTRSEILCRECLSHFDSLNQRCHRVA